MTTPHFAIADITPYLPWLVVACVALAILVAVGLGVILHFGRRLRTDFASEIRREIETVQEATKVQVQQPLIVKEHNPNVSTSDHLQLRQEFQDLREQRRKDVHSLHVKIEQGLENVKNTQAQQSEKIVKLQSDTDHQTKQLSNLSTKMDQVLMRLPRPEPQ